MPSVGVGESVRNCAAGFLLSVLLLVAALAGLRAAEAAEPGGAPLPEQFVLPNGLKVILLEDHSFPVVSSAVWYRTGARNETMGGTGVSHLVEHLLFRRAGNMRPGELGAMIARVGGQFNGYTSDDFMTFFEVLSPSKLETGLQVEAERMRSAPFTEKDVQNEVANIKREFQAEAADAAQVLAREVRAAAFQQHPYHNPTMGWQGDVENLTVAQARAYYERFIRTDNATLVLVGDFKPAAVMPLIRKHFAALPKPSGRQHTQYAAEPPQKGERRVVVKSSGNRELLEVAYHAPAIQEPDAAALAVMEKVFNSAYSGRLKSKLVDTKICSSAAARFEAKKDPGLFEIMCVAAAGTGEQKLGEALDSLVNQLRDQPISDAELRQARNQAEFAYCAVRDGPYHAGFQLGFFDSLSNWQNAFTWTERLRAVTAADIQRAARRYFNPDNRVIGWVSSPNAPKIPQAKSDPAPEPSPPAEKKAPPRGRQGEHVRMTGYKRDDFAVGPEQARQAGTTRLIGQLPSQMAPLPGIAEGVSDPAPGGGPAPGAPQAQAPAQPETKAAPASAAAAAGTSPAAAQSQQSIAAPSLPPLPKLPQERASRAIHRKVLKNGLTLVVYESHLSPIVEIAGAVKAGDAFDPPGKKGLSAVTASALNFGSGKHNRSQMLALQEALGLPPPAMLKFDDGMETIDFGGKCLSRDLPAVLALLGESLASPAFQEGDVEKAKLDVISSIRRQQDSVGAKVDRALRRSLVAGSSPYAPPDPVERVKSVSGLKPEDVRDFHANFITPADTCIVLVGDVSMEQATQMAEKALGAWSGSSRHQIPAVQANARHILKTSVPIKDRGQAIVSFGQLVPLSRAHQDYGALLLADCALTNHPIFSRLGQVVSAEPKLAAAVGSEALESRVSALADSLEWSLTVSPEASAVPYVVRRLQDELRNFSRNGVTPQEVAEAKLYLSGAIPVRSMSTIDAVADNVLASVLQDGEPDYLFRMLASVRTASVESINRIIRSIFKPDQASLVVAGSSQTISALRDQTAKPPAKSSGKS